MTIRGQLYVMLAGAAGGLLAVVAYWLIGTPEAEYRDVAIGALVYATGYVLTVPRASRWIKRHPSFVKNPAVGDHTAS